MDLNRVSLLEFYCVPISLALEKTLEGYQAVMCGEAILKLYYPTEITAIYFNNLLKIDIKQTYFFAIIFCLLGEARQWH